MINFQIFFVISLGVTFPRPKTCSKVSVLPEKLIEYPPKGFFLDLDFDFDLDLDLVLLLEVGFLLDIDLLLAAKILLML